MTNYLNFFQIIRRSCPEEKFLVLTKQQIGHSCSHAWIVMAIIKWEGLKRSDADFAYTFLAHKLGKHGITTDRKCAKSMNSACICQGSPLIGGATFTCGCSYSHHYDLCKFAKSKMESVRKFRLNNSDDEDIVEEMVNRLATEMAGVYHKLAPVSFANHKPFDRFAYDCRIGNESTHGKPFSGATIVSDYCAHAHKDMNNIQDGSTVVVTLLKPENRDATPEDITDEQFHVLPGYLLDGTDESGSEEEYKRKIESGSIQINKK